MQRCQVYRWKRLSFISLSLLSRSSQAHARWNLVGEGVNCRICSAGNVTCNGCAGNAAHNVLVASAPAAPLPCLGLQDRLPAATAQLPAQQPARRGPAQHRPVIGGTGKNISQLGEADASELFHGEMCNLWGKVCISQAACSHLTHRMLCACLTGCLCVAAEALVPAQASSSESALRQRLMAQLNSAQGAAVAAGSPAWAQPGTSWTTAAFQAPAAAAPPSEHTHAAHAASAAATAAPDEPDELMKFSGTASCEQRQSSCG